MKNTYFVILAGGCGERLWPLSRRQHPKQLIPFLNNKSLLEQTLDRISSLVAKKEHIVVVTNKDYEQAVQKLIGSRVGMIIAEEAARNTAPAILLACEYIKKEDSDAKIVVLPADAYIPDHNAFCATIADGLDYLEFEECKDIVTFGLRPTYAATGYGYIQSNSKESCGAGYRIARFHEKPDQIHAQIYATQGDMWWNIGIFAACLKTFDREFTEHAPDVVMGISRYLLGQIAYEQVPNISIDYAVMEKSANIVVFPALFDWSDVGNLNVFLSLRAQHAPDNIPVINFDGSGNLASTKQKLVVCVGVSDLCIVETDDVILITKKDMAENIKKVLPQVKKTDQNYL